MKKKTPDVPFEDSPQETGESIPVKVTKPNRKATHVRGSDGKWHLDQMVCGNLIRRGNDG